MGLHRAGRQVPGRAGGECGRRRALVARVGGRMLTSCLNPCPRGGTDGGVPRARGQMPQRTPLGGRRGRVECQGRGRASCRGQEDEQGRQDGPLHLSLQKIKGLGRSSSSGASTCDAAPGDQGHTKQVVGPFPSDLSGSGTHRVTCGDLEIAVSEACFSPTVVRK